MKGIKHYPLAIIGENLNVWDNFKKQIKGNISDAIFELIKKKVKESE